jgi:tRNA-dihydrouridine synthase B
MWQIGELKIDGRAVLGPMSGFTSRSYRDFMKPFGASLCFTEMVSDAGIIHGQRRTRGYFDFSDNHPTGIQLFGHVPEDISEAAVKALEINPEIELIDVNMGCPVPKVNRSGAGSALMRDPKLCGDIIRSLKRKTDVPVTAKIRLGWSSGSINFRDVIGELELAGVDAITVHARTRDERYAGEPHMDMVEGLRGEMSVPLIISGNIYQLDDAINAMRITGADAVMVARGGVGNPFLLTQIDRYFRTGERLRSPKVSQQIDWCLQFMEMLIDEIGEEKAMRKMRCFAPRFIAGCHYSRAHRNNLATNVTDKDSLLLFLENIRQELGNERIYDNAAADYSDFEEVR